MNQRCDDAAKPAAAGPGGRASAPADRPDRLLNAGLILAVIGFAVFVEMRGALLKYRRTDLDVYLRAAWAARTGGDIYAAADDNDWHYHYPPLMAIALIPLADPPRGAPPAGWVVPFPVSVAVWYFISVVCLWFAVHLPAKAMQETSPDPAVRARPRFGKWWWAIRLAPILFCLPAIGRSLARGQTGPLLLLLVGAAAADFIRRRGFRAGVWLAAAACVKVIPAFLFLYPLWRRDWRCLAGAAAGLFAGLIAVPAVVLGPERTITAYRSLCEEVLAPGLFGTAGGTRSEELTGVSSTDSNSPLTVMHNIQYLDIRPEDRPLDAAPAVRAAHWAIALALTGATLWAAGLRRPPGGDDATNVLLFLGALSLVNMIISPVSHPHYLCAAVTVVSGLAASKWERIPFPALGFGLAAVLWLNFAAHLVTGIWMRVILRDVGAVLFTSLAIWFAAVRALARRTGLNAAIPAPSSG